jgi:hypothetical protein
MKIPAQFWRIAMLTIVSGSSCASAMSFYVDPPNLFLGGGVVRSDWSAWEEAMIKFDGKIDTIVFYDSGGGDSLAGRRIGEDIRARKLGTVVLGRCSSACANMFLGGVTRQYASPKAHVHTVLGYHGSYNKKTRELNRNKSPDYFLHMTDGKMSEEFVERFIRLENKSGLLRLVHPKQLLKTSEPLAMLCKGDEDKDRREEECEKLDGVDALLKGVVTTWDTREIPTPPKATREKITVKLWESRDTKVDKP